MKFGLWCFVCLCACAVCLHVVRESKRCEDNPLFDKAPFETNCPDDKWVDAMVKVDAAPGKVIVNVGCNKGNDAVKWASRWDPDRFFDVEKWVTAFGIYNFACPWTTAASDSQVAMESKDGARPNPTVVCVEAGPATFRALQKTAADLHYAEHGNFHIIGAAVVAKALPGQLIDFPDVNVGNEQAGLLQSAGPKVPVPARTVDEIVQSLNLTRVDVLSIDIEGYDPAALDGAEKTIESVRYIEFEVHRDFPGTPWASVTLRSVVDKLGSKGFDCFWAGNTGRLLDLGRCWKDSFENGAWSNAVCVRRSDVWRRALATFE